jgi:hypothetical protein
MVQKKFFTEVVLLTKSYNLQDFKDWMHWHLDIIGFQRCHVFDNESSVDIKSVCDSYGDRVTYELIKGWPNQYALYNRYINNESPAWWVLPIDDDEFLYVSDKYKNNVNMFLLANSKAHPDWCKVCVGWRNMFPEKFTETRTNPHMVLNATGWSNEASAIWQYGNMPIKTFVNTIYKYDWADKDGQHRTHNPFVAGIDKPGYTTNNETIWTCKQSINTKGTEPLILYHYQFKSNTEWKHKCANRKSPGAKWFNKNYPNKYNDLYQNNHNIHNDNRMVHIWNG